MPKKALINLTEPMFYVLMAFRNGPLCGTDIASNVNELTSGRVNIGPATLYTLLVNNSLWAVTKYIILQIL